MREVLILVFIAAVLAAGISPAVHRVRVLGRYRLHRNISRGAAAVIVYFPFLLLVILLAVLMVPRLIGETRALNAQLPALIEHNLLTPLQRYFPIGAVREYLKDGVTLPRGHVFGYVRGAATVIALVRGGAVHGRLHAHRRAPAAEHVPSASIRRTCAATGATR